MNQKIKDVLEKFILALKSLENAVAEPVENQRDLSGIIKNFEFVYELSWKTLQRVVGLEGEVTRSPRETFQAAYQFGFIEDEKLWLDIIEDRNLTSHTYDEKLAGEICQKIGCRYFAAFQQLLLKIQEKYPL